MTTLLFPATPGVQVHASTLLPLSGGGVLAAWFAGPHEGHPDTRIQVLRRSGTDETIVDILPGDSQPHWNPVLTWGPDGAAWLFFKRGPRIDEWTTWVAISPDEGLTWHEPFELVPGDRSGGRGPVRQAPLHVGLTWLAAGSVEEWSMPRWDCFVDLSTDDGDSWRRVLVPLDHDATAGAGCIQPWVVPGRHSQLVMLTRSTAGAVFRSATDDPADWPELRPTALPNNNSGIAVESLPDGALVCVHNDASGDWGARSRLVVSRSDDDGLTWRQVAVLEDGTLGGADGSPTTATATGVVTTGDGEYSYPSAVVEDDELWVTYSWQRRSIALARLPLSALAHGL
ncbi:MAG: exo-alpha-sialidase [Arachnia sp.]